MGKCCLGFFLNNSNQLYCSPWNNCLWWLLRIYKDDCLLTWVLLRLHFSTLELLMKCWMLINPSNIYSFKICLLGQSKWKKPSGIVSKCLFFSQIKTWIFNLRKTYRLERDSGFECLVLGEQKLSLSSSEWKHQFHSNSVWGKCLLSWGCCFNHKDTYPSLVIARTFWVSPVYLFIYLSVWLFILNKSVVWLQITSADAKHD